MTKKLHFERERALHEKANLINTGIRKGIEQRIHQNKVDTISRFNSMGINVEQIAQRVDLTVEEVKDIISKHLN